MAIVGHNRTVYGAKEGERFSADTELHVVACPSCHVTYAIPQSFYRAARKYNQNSSPSDYWEVCCPFGHSWAYTGLNREQKLEEQLRVANDRAGRLAAERDQTEARRRSQKGATTRAKKRHAAGVCPACNRSFKQLREHMERMHPDYDPSA